MSGCLAAWIAACCYVRKPLSVIILVPDMTHLTGNSIFTERATLMGDTFTP